MGLKKTSFENIGEDISPQYSLTSNFLLSLLSITNTSTSDTVFSIWAQDIEADMDHAALQLNAISGGAFPLRTIENRIYLYKSIVMPPGISLEIDGLLKKFEVIQENRPSFSMVFEMESGSADLFSYDADN